MDKDISTLLREVKAETGWSEPKIAKEIHTSQPTVNRILKGQSECKSSTLRSIEALHTKHCGAGRHGRRSGEGGAVGVGEAHLQSP